MTKSETNSFGFFTFCMGIIFGTAIMLAVVGAAHTKGVLVTEIPEANTAIVTVPEQCYKIEVHWWPRIKTFTASYKCENEPNFTVKRMD